MFKYSTVLTKNKNQQSSHDTSPLIWKIYNNQVHLHSYFIAIFFHVKKAINTVEQSVRSYLLRNSADNQYYYFFFRIQKVRFKNLNLLNPSSE